MKTFLAFIVTVLFFNAFPTAAIAQTAISQTDSGVDIFPITVNRNALLQLVNAVRKKGCQCGDTYYYPAPALTWNVKLEQAAYNHTLDMAKNKYFSHKAPDGSRGSDRLDRVGYNWKSFGENIGQGYKTEKDMIQGWLASAGHCKNIMNKSFAEMGVAKVGMLWTQTFGSR